VKNQELARNHLKLADETCEAYKGSQAGTTYQQRVVLSFALSVVRALVAALADISDAIREKKK
jgi:hypothetical protein